MKIHVDGGAIIRNRKAPEGAKLEPVFMVDDGKATRWGHSVEFSGPCSLTYDPYNPTNLGAVAWVEVPDDVKVTLT